MQRGKMRYRVSYYDGGKRVRPSFPTKAAADSEAARLRNDIAQLGSVWINLPAAERSQLMAAWDKAKKNGVDLMTLAEKPPAPPVVSSAKKLSEIITELIGAKDSAGRDSEYTKSLKRVLNQFAKGKESVPIDLVTFEHVETFINTKRLAYRATIRARLSTMFNFAMRRHYIKNNPCTQLEAITYHKPPPQIFKPEELKALLKWLVKNPKGMTWFVLTTLCGLRPDEARKTPKEKIQTDAGIIVVDTQTTKVRERRVVTPMKEAMEWLNLSLKLGGKTPFSKQVKKRLLKQLRKVVGFTVWPKDITRHTAATIWLARIKSAAEVAEQLGNSERVLKRDYKALITPKQLAVLLAVITELPSKPRRPNNTRKNVRQRRESNTRLAAQQVVPPS
jgi:integrase